MARMHTRKRGRSKSRKVTTSTAQLWVQLQPEQVEEIIAGLATEGKTEAEIGLVLRDQHGIPGAKTVTGRTVSQILREKKLLPEYPSDLLDLIKRAVKMRQHLVSNKKDISNRTKLVHVESKIKRLVKYYRGKRLPAGWKYDPVKAALLVK